MKSVSLLLLATMLAFLPHPAAASSTSLSEAELLLIEAVKSGNTSKAAALLEQPVDPNLMLPDNSSLLAWAVESQVPELVELLLDYGAQPDINGYESENLSPLLLSCLYGRAEMTESLLRNGAFVNRTTQTGISPLALCAGNASTETVAELLDLGAAVDAADDGGQTPLMWAAAKGRIDSMRLLLSSGANLNRSTDKGLTPLFFALQSGNPGAPVVLMEAGADLAHRSEDGTSVVQMAIYQKQFNFAGRLVELGVDLEEHDRNGNQLLHAAVINGQSDLVDLLLAKGADPNALTGESEVVWRYEANFTTAPYVVYPKSPLFLAAELGQAEIMQSLVAAGADPAFEIENGTNLVLASANAQPDSLAYALELLPDANVTNKAGQTLLHMMVSLGTYQKPTNEQMREMFQMLAAQGAKADIANASGLTAMELAESDQFKASAEFFEVFGTSR